MGNLDGGPLIVTGVAGFIGSHVAEALLARRTAVLGIDNFDPFYPRETKRRNLAEVEAAARRAGVPFEFLDADITDEDAMRRVFERAKPVGVIHLAAKAGVRPSIADPPAYMRANVLGTSVLLDAARRVDCPRFVLASSSSVYGNAAKVPFAEDDPVDHPISPYAASKRACELLASTHHALTKMPTACLRFFTVYGPRQRPDLAIQHFLARISRGEDITLFGDGSTSRDYTYIDDITAGVLAAFDRIDRYALRTWNLGGSSPISLRDMVAVIERVVGRPAAIQRRPAQPGDVERTYADLTRSRAELNYAPSVPFEEGVRRQWAWMRDLGAR